MKRFIQGTLITFVLLFTLVSQVGQQEIPPANDPTHPGQPSWCQNFADKVFKSNCSCKPEFGSEACKSGEKGGGENPKCKVYCRKSSCKCDSMCTSQHKSKIVEHRSE